MSADAVLFLGRIVFLAGLYVFIFVVVARLRRELRTRSVAPEAAAPGELVVMDAGETGLHVDDAFPLVTVTLVGREMGNTVVLPDGTVSARHARLVHADHAWTVEDLGSTNGTFLNGRPVRSRSRIEYGDVIAFGGVSMKLVRS